MAWKLKSAEFVLKDAFVDKMTRKEVISIFHGKEDFSSVSNLRFIFLIFTKVRSVLCILALIADDSQK